MASSHTPRKVRILSSFRAFDTILKGSSNIQHQYIGQDDGSRDTFYWIRWIGTAARACYSSDFLVFNIDPRRLLVTCAIFLLIGPRFLRRCRIVSVDIVLRAPCSWRDRISAWFKRFCYQQIDLFILYFRNIDGYVKHFGISRDRTVYVPFKVNSWEQLVGRRSQIGEGKYVLLAGSTLRDHATFVKAVRRCGVPALLLVPGAQGHEVRQSSWYQSGLPLNLKIEFDTDGREETYLSYFERAKIVCLPRFRWDIGPSGISAALCAMGLGKCVVISRGPGAEDIFAETQAALFFEPENADDLARTLRETWERPDLCSRIAENGARYAESVQGQERLLEDIIAALELN